LTADKDTDNMLNDYFYPVSLIILTAFVSYWSSDLLPPSDYPQELLCSENQFLIFYTQLIPVDPPVLNAYQARCWNEQLIATPQLSPSF